MAWPAEAAAPRIAWKTIVTPRLRVHYHEGSGELASRVARDAEQALTELSALLEHHPSTPIHLVITDETDDANGFAEILPQNIVTIFAGVPPVFSTLGDYDDFTRLLVLHELVHIVHIDTILGIPRWVNLVFGKTFIPNSVQPQWVVEGIAVFLESRLTSGGRVKSHYIDMLIRGQILAGTFPEIDRLSHFTRTFPGSSYPWFLGGRFIDFIARRHGVAAIAHISRLYGARPIPWAINLVAEKATGETFIELFDLWVADERRRAQAIADRVAEEGAVLGTAVDRESALVLHPRFSADGRLAVVEQPRDDDSDIVILDGVRGTERLRLRTNDGRGAFTPDGRFYIATISDTIDIVYSHRDLERIDVRTGARVRRTEGWRATEPDVSPDGETIVAVAQEAGRTRLVTLSTFGEDPPVTWDVLNPGEQVYDPRWSPSGRQVAASVLIGNTGGRHIVVFDRATGRRVQLTDGASRNHTPTWSPDGSSIFYSSDHEGVFNIHRVDVRSGRRTRLTNVVTGAFQPAVHPAGDRLVYVHGLSTGFELRELPFPLAGWPVEAETIARRTVTATASPAVYPQEDYTAWPSLLPKAWFPATGLDGVGDTIGVILEGNDAIKQHVWTLDLQYGLTSERLGFAFEYSNRQTPFPLSISTSLAHTTRPGRFAASVPQDDRLETIFRARAGLTVPLGRWDSGHALSFSYGVETRRGLTLFSLDPQAPSPRGLGDITLTALSASWSFSNVRGFGEGVSSARGQSYGISVRLHAPELGSDLRVLDFSASWSSYLPMPWLDHHVLATRLRLGGATGDARGRSVFVLGGLPIRNVVSDAIDGFGSGSDVVRGYEVAALRGSAFYLGTAEYRFPIVSLTQGWWTLPFYLDRLNAAFYVDAGATPASEIDLGATKVGVGGELRLDLRVGYAISYTLRLGLARGLSEDGINNVYFVLGGVF